MDPIKKSEELRKKMSSMNEGIFGKLFGKKENNSIMKYAGGKSWVLNGNEIKTLKAQNDPTMTNDLVNNYDWKSGKLSWLTNAKFKAHLVYIDFDKEVVTVFVGEWNEGSFMGEEFSQVGVSPGQSVFKGGTFGSESGGGELAISEKFWKAKPTDFINGTIPSSKAFILGMPNKIHTHGEFHLIQAPENHTINIGTEDRMSYQIFVTKRLDSVSSMFSYKLLHSGERKNLPWKNIRDNFNAFYVKVGEVLDIPGLIKTSSKIVSINIVPGKEQTKSQPKSAATSSQKPIKKYVFSVNLLPPSIKKRFKSSLKKNWEISIKDEDNLNKFKSFKDDFINGGSIFESHITNIKDGIEIGLIDGYGGYPHLVLLWGKDNKGGFKSGDNPEYANSMKYMDSFIKSFVMRLGKTRKEAIIKVLKSELGISSAAPQKKVAKTPTKTTTKKTAGSDEEKLKSIQSAPKKPLKEEVLRNHIRNLLRDETFFPNSSL